MRQHCCLLLFVTGLFALSAFSGCGTSEPPATKSSPPAVSTEQPTPPPVVRNEPPPAPTPDEQKVTPPATPQETHQSGNFAVQLGAYKQQESADRIAGLAKERYNRMVSITYDNSAGLYKVSIGSFPSKDDARRFRDTMVQQYPTDYKDAWVSEIPPK